MYHLADWIKIKYISSDFGKGSTFSTPSSGSYICNPFRDSNVSLIQNDWCNWLNSWRTWRGAPYNSYSYEFIGGVLMGANIINIPRNFLKEFVGEFDSGYSTNASESEFVLSSKLDTIIPEGYLSKCRSYTGGVIPQQFYNGSLKGVIPKTFLKSCESVYFRRFFENQYNLSGIEDGFLSHEFTARSIPYGSIYYSTERIFYGTKFKNIPDSFLSNANGISTSSLAYILYNSELTSPPYFFNRVSNCVSLEQAFSGTKFTNSDGAWDNVLLTFTSNNNLLTNAWNLFSNSKIARVPDNFMYNCPNITDARSIFYGSQLMSLPLNMLSTGTNSGCNISGLFGYCRSLTGTIPNGFLKNVKATSITDVFSNTKLTGLIPSDLLEGCSGYVTNCASTFHGSLFNGFVNNTWNVSDFSKVTTFERMFYSSNTSQIPNTFCNKNFNVLTNAASMFQSSKVQSVPDGFLSNCPILANVASMFRDCIYINSIGLNVLYNCPNINNAYAILFRTTSLNELLKESFLYNSTKMVTFVEFARESGIIGIEANSFFYRLNASVSNKNFDRSFQKCLSFTGSVLELWNLYGSTTSSHLYTFAESINISNYSSIPSSWK